MARILTDEDFRKEVQADPKAALTKALGRSLPEDHEVQLLEEGPKQHYFVIPHIPDSLDKSKLTTEYLEDMLAAGCTFCDSIDMQTSCYGYRISDEIRPL